MNIDPGWLALIGTLCGGTGLKIVEHYLNRKQVKVTDASKIRDELREQIDDQRAEIAKLEKEVEGWRDKYYNLRDDHIKLQTELMISLQKLKEDMGNDNHGNG